MEQIILEHELKQVRQEGDHKKRTGPHKEHMVPDNEMTASVGRAGAMNAIYLDFCEAFDMAIHNSLTSKLERYGLTDGLLDG